MNKFYQDNREEIENYIEFACQEGTLVPEDATEMTEDEKVKYFAKGQADDLQSTPF